MTAQAANNIVPFPERTIERIESPLSPDDELLYLILRYGPDCAREALGTRNAADILSGPTACILAAVEESWRAGCGGDVHDVAARLKAVGAPTEPSTLRALAYCAPAYTQADAERRIKALVRTLTVEHARRERAAVARSLAKACNENAPDVPALLARLQELERELQAGASIGEAELPILSSGEFVRGFTPPDYLLDGVLQRGFLYSFTGQTGSGKTAIALRLKAHTALGTSLAGRDVQKCRTLMLAGENHTDVQMRWIALGEQMGFVPDEMPVDFIPRVFSIESFLPRIRDLATQVGGYGLVVVDTSAAYFEGDDENANKILGDHARKLRLLTQIAGRPCVVVNAHPIKNVQQDNLLPRGGSAFLAEVDGNLTCAKKDGVVEVAWQGKFRGPDFEPMAFALETVRSNLLRDSRGRHVPTIYARPLSETEQTTIARRANGDLRKLISIMAQSPELSISALAEKAGWVSASGQAQKSKVSRLLQQLKQQSLATKQLDTWTLTPAGEKAAKAKPI